MKRRDFLKRLGFVAVGTIAAPLVVKELVKNRDLSFAVYEKTIQLRSDGMSGSYIEMMFDRYIEEMENDGIYLVRALNIETTIDIETLSSIYTQRLLVADIPKKYHENVGSVNIKDAFHTIEIPL